MPSHFSYEGNSIFCGLLKSNYLLFLCIKLHLVQIIEKTIEVPEEMLISTIGIQVVRGRPFAVKGVSCRTVQPSRKEVKVRLACGEGLLSF
jgi:hypothetical protein